MSGRTGRAYQYVPSTLLPGETQAEDRPGPEGRSQCSYTAFWRGYLLWTELAEEANGGRQPGG